MRGVVNVNIICEQPIAENMGQAIVAHCVCVDHEDELVRVNEIRFHEGTTYTFWTCWNHAITGGCVVVVCDEYGTNHITASEDWRVRTT